MIGSVAGRHMSTRRRMSVVSSFKNSQSLSLELPESLGPKYVATRRRAVSTKDAKNCALIHERFKLGDIM